MKLQQARYEFILEAAQPLCHLAENIGNEGIAMRESIRQAGGGFVDVPIATGDTMRHGLREAAAYAYLNAAGLLDDPRLSEAALRLLFAGGMVTGKGDAGTISLDLYREMTEVIPSLRLFGGCTNSRVIPGQSAVDAALLICAESMRAIHRVCGTHDGKPWVGEWLAREQERIESARVHVAEEQRVRMDPTLVPEKRLLLSTDAQVSLNARLTSGEKAHETGDALTAEREKSTMMPRRYEVVKRGSLFFWGFEANCYTPLDLDTLHVAAAAYLANMRVGGKRATGHGLMRPVAMMGVTMPELARPADALASTFGPRVGDIFREHVASRAARIREILNTVDA